MGRINRFFVTFGIVLFFAGILPLSALDAYVTVIYRDVDVAFIHRSDKELDSILGKNNDDKNYYLIENYTMKKIRHLVVSQDYDFANEATLVVIDNNLDNMEAVELYATISAALQKQKEQQLALEQKQQAETEKYEAEKAKQRAIVEKDYVTVKTASGDTVYLKEKYEKYTSNYWSFRFGMLDATYVVDSGSDYNSFRYGVSGDFTFEYSFDKIMIGTDVGGDAIIIPFNNDDNTIIGNFALVPKFGFRRLKNLSFRTGFATVIRIDSGDGNNTTLQETLLSPVFGVGLNHINIGKAELSMNADYLLGHLAYDGLNCAVNSSLNIALPIMEMEKVRLNFNFGVKDTLFVKESGVENRAGIILAIGAQNVIK